MATSSQHVRFCASHDGTRIISGGYDNTVRVWEARSGKDLLFLKGHTGQVSRVAISNDGKRIFAQEDSGKVLATPAIGKKAEVANAREAVRKDMLQEPA